MSPLARLQCRMASIVALPQLLHKKGGCEGELSKRASSTQIYTVINSSKTISIGIPKIPLLWHSSYGLRKSDPTAAGFRHRNLMRVKGDCLGLTAP